MLYDDAVAHARKLQRRRADYGGRIERQNKGLGKASELMDGGAERQAQGVFLTQHIGDGLFLEQGGIIVRTYAGLQRHAKSKQVKHLLGA